MSIAEATALASQWTRTYDCGCTWLASGAHVRRCDSHLVPPVQQPCPQHQEHRQAYVSMLATAMMLFAAGQGVEPDAVAARDAREACDASRKAWTDARFCPCAFEATR